MKNLFLLSLLPTFLMTTAQAQDMTVSFDMSSVTTKTSDVKLYNFSPELINAAQNCTPYQEDFIKNNPDLGQNIPMLGGAKLAVNINILGYNEQGKCQFSVQQDITGLAKTTYNCLISHERQKDLINAMQDRSTTPITATFTTYSTIDYGDGRIEKQPLEQTMTDGKFNIVWAQTIAQDCQIKEESPSAQEQQNLVEDMQTFSEAFLASLQKCQPASEEKQLFILTEKAEIIGIEDKGCHIKYADFDLYVPLDKLSSIKTMEDIKTLTGDKNISQYTPQFITLGLKEELHACLSSSSYHQGASETTSSGNITVKNQMSSEKRDNECVLTFTNTLNNNGETREYKKICRIPLSKIAELLNIEEQNMLSTMEEQNLCQ